MLLLSAGSARAGTPNVPLGCTVTSISKASCSFTSNGLPAGYVVAATSWKLKVGRKVVASSKAGSPAVGQVPAANGATVSIFLLSPGAAAIGG